MASVKELFISDKGHSEMLGELPPPGNTLSEENMNWLAGPSTKSSYCSPPIRRPATTFDDWSSWWQSWWWWRRTGRWTSTSGWVSKSQSQTMNCDLDSGWSWDPLNSFCCSFKEWGKDFTSLEFFLSTCGVTILNCLVAIALPFLFLRPL